MDDKEILTGTLLDESTTISFLEVCRQYQLPQELLFELIEHGIIQVQGKNIKQMRFDYRMLSRIQSAARLKEDLGINLPGIAVILDLLEELQQIRDELRILQRQIDHS
ncbi:chaperone modulator CbpM [Legionella londiniensis]|uniref:Putative chaperone-modulator protein CbpM n=1 Tax=Legionella londiniensis TaxID=45068 RepID=A0A0W0VQW0_9GAMM|nr:chaperone modulator CbpM [Legionella londiniensis]KTD22546.1 putative chaperone-modulator protein CbpM [Legionella londiniensis]STX92477.1 putative chaperone-modulator protein CbpM [Legionella londiniensis]